MSENPMLSNGRNQTADAGIERQHEVRIERRLGIVYRREGFEVPDNDTPLDALLAKEDNTADHEPDWLVRCEALRGLLAYFFAEGPHPGVVLRRVFAVTWALDRSLVANMTQTDMAIMFDETKASQSWRIKKIFSGYLQKWGAKGFKAPGQKTETAGRAYAAAAMGNKNRSGGDAAHKQKRNGHGDDNRKRKNDGC